VTAPGAGWWPERTADGRARGMSVGAFDMKIRSLTVGVSLSVLLAASAADAADRYRPKSDRLDRHVTAAPSPYVSSRAPAHMVEVKPGMWISSYGCVMDEGYGRLRNCSDVRLDR
jgi:hypothetical protein